MPMLSSFWEWLQTASQGQATFVGALTGSFFGLLALLLGALANAGLNRGRDNRLRKQDQRAVATALRAELEALRRTLKDNAETMSQEDYAKPDEYVHVQDLAQSIRIMPEVLSKLSLLDGKTIGAVVDAYGMAEEYSAKLLLLGGHLGLTPDNFRRYVALPSNRVTQIVQLNNVTTKMIEESLKQLGTTRRWREMSWPSLSCRLLLLFHVVPQASGRSRAAGYVRAARRAQGGLPHHGRERLQRA